MAEFFLTMKQREKIRNDRSVIVGFTLLLDPLLRSSTILGKSTIYLDAELYFSWHWCEQVGEANTWDTG